MRGRGWSVVAVVVVVVVVAGRRASVDVAGIRDLLAAEVESARDADERTPCRTAGARALCAVMSAMVLVLPGEALTSAPLSC